MMTRLPFVSKEYVVRDPKGYPSTSKLVVDPILAGLRSLISSVTVCFVSSHPLHNRHSYIGYSTLLHAVLSNVLKHVH